MNASGWNIHQKIQVSFLTLVSKLRFTVWSFVFEWMVRNFCHALSLYSCAHSSRTVWKVHWLLLQQLQEKGLWQMWCLQVNTLSCSGIAYGRESSMTLLITGPKKSSVARAKYTKLVVSIKLQTFHNVSVKTNCNSCRYHECQKQKYTPKKKNLPKAPNTCRWVCGMWFPKNHGIPRYWTHWYSYFEAYNSGNKQVLHESAYPIMPVVLWLLANTHAWPCMTMHIEQRLIKYNIAWFRAKSDKWLKM